MAQGAAAERHAADAARARGEVEELLRQARLLLRGDVRLVPGPPHPKRSEREQQLEQVLEKTEWHRREIKRLKAILEARDRLHAGHHQLEARERDPMELHNLVVERRKELRQIQRNIESMEHVNELQRRGEAKDSVLRPEVHDKLKRLKNEVEQLKRLNVRLQADRLKFAGSRKVAEDDLRSARVEQRSKAQLMKIGSEEEIPAGLKQLRRDVDILRGAIKQDERRFKASEREDAAELEFAAEQLAAMQRALVDKREAIERMKRPRHYDFVMP